MDGEGGISSGNREACTRASIPHLRPAEYKRSTLPRNQRTVNLPYGGVLSGAVVREREETVVIPVSLGAAPRALTELNVHWPESLLTWLLSVDTWSKIQVKILTPADMASVNSTRSCKYPAYYKAQFREHRVRKKYKTIIWSGEGDSALET